MIEIRFQMAPALTPSRRADPIVCECLRVRESQILLALKSGRVKRLNRLTRLTGAGDGCTACHPMLREYLSRRRRYFPSSPSPSFCAR